MRTEANSSRTNSKRHTSRGLRKTDNPVNRERRQESVNDARQRYKSTHSSVPTGKKFPGPVGHEAGDSSENLKSSSRTKDTISHMPKSGVNTAEKLGSKSIKHNDSILQGNKPYRKHHKIDSGKHKAGSSHLDEQKGETFHSQVKTTDHNLLGQRTEAPVRSTKKQPTTKIQPSPVSKDSRSQLGGRSGMHVNTTEVNSTPKLDEKMERKPPEKGDEQSLLGSNYKLKENQEEKKERTLLNPAIDVTKTYGHYREELKGENHKVDFPRNKEQSDVDDYASDFDDATSDSSSTTNSVTSTPTKDVFLSTGPTNTNHKERKQPLSTAAPQLIDFNRSLTIHKRGISQRLQQRATDLKRLIELEMDCCLSLFDLKPLDEYSNYILRFGKTNRCQAQTQTQDDAIDKDVQTELIEYCPGGGVWTQWPPLDNGECSGRPENFRIIGSFCKNRLQSHIENISDKYMDDLLRDFSSTFQTSSSLTSSKHGIHTLSDSIISQINLMLTILKEEQIPELVDSLQDRHIVPDDEDFVQPFAQINAENSENEEAAAPQPSLHGDSGCVACAFAPFNGDALLTIHCPTTICLPNSLDDLTGFVYPAGEIIFVWSISSGSCAPKHQLYCPGLSETGFRGANITRAIFSPDADASMVIGGLADGSLCIWDLRTSPYGLCSMQIFVSPPTSSDPSGYPRTVYAKAPIYSTSGIDIHQITPSQTSNPDSESQITGGPDSRQSKSTQVQLHHNHSHKRHSVPIVDIQLTRSVKRSDASSTSFQCAALDQSGELSLWMVLRPSKVKTQNIIENLAGSRTDLGLRPAEHVAQMVCLAYIVPKLTVVLPIRPQFAEINSRSSPGLDKMKNIEEKSVLALRTKPTINTTTLAVSNRGFFLLGFSSGMIAKLARSSNQSVYPRQFKQPSNQATVRCLAVHPVEQFEVFLAGYADGLIRLFHFDRPNPLYEWNLSENRDCELAAVKLIWSYNRPALFFCLDSSGRVTSFDLIDAIPSHPCGIQIQSDMSNLSSTVHNPEMVIHVPAVKTGANRVYDFALSRGVLVSSSGRPQIISAFALIYPEAVKIHWLDRRWSLMIENELQRTTDILEQLLYDV